MDRKRITERLSSNAGVFRSLLDGVGEDQARWKPAPEQWSLLEVINHLADEEREDFRRRLDLTLHRPGEPWPPIDPPRWAAERRYNEREPGASLDDFLAERGESIRWLRGLETIDEAASYEHPVLGTLSAGDLLTSWLAHDLIHIRQMTRLHRQYLLEALSPHSAGYAGEW